MLHGKTAYIKYINKGKKKYFLIFFFLILSVFLTKFIVEKNQRLKQQTLHSFYNHDNLPTVKQFLFKKIASPYIDITHEVQNNESIKKILDKYKITNKDVNAVINLIKTYGDPNNIDAGSIFKIVLEKKFDDTKNLLKEVTIPITKTISIKVEKSQEGSLLAKKIVTKLYKRIELAENIIKNNLYSSAIKAKIEPNVIIEFARIYGFEIDFQRDIRENDRFQILYEKFFDEKDEFVKNGSIIYAYMSINNREISVYKFGDDKNFGYFDASGKSVEKALMKTPINGARLSSSFGIRKHPILGYNKMHRGTDFAAKTGTPIMASGSGTVTVAKWNGGYGKYIKIKHNSTYSTAYAHLSNFARGIKSGKKVKQGQIIGYVGSTGKSTGPHLHYEVIINGKKVNSQKLKLPSGKTLKDKERKLFEIHRIKTDVLISEMVLEKNG